MWLLFSGRWWPLRYSILTCTACTALHLEMFLFLQHACLLRDFLFLCLLCSSYLFISVLLFFSPSVLSQTCFLSSHSCKLQIKNVPLKCLWIWLTTVIALCLPTHARVNEGQTTFNSKFLYTQKNGTWSVPHMSFVVHNSLNPRGETT